MYINDEKIEKIPPMWWRDKKICFDLLISGIAGNNACESRLSAYNAIFAFYAMTKKQEKTNTYKYIRSV